jgi:tetrahydromethanopterin S-methyltransferase subunit G
MTTGQFTILMNELGDFRKEVNCRFDKVDERLTPLEDERQQRIGADKKTRQIAGVSKATIATIVAVVSAVVAVASAFAHP